MPRLSIVIPYLGCKKRLEDTLVSVLANRPRDCEIIVVHDGTYHDEYDLADEVDFVVERTATSLTELANVGFWEAAAEIVHLLKPGAIVGEGWVEPSLNQFDDPHIASVSPLLLNDDAPAVIVAAGVEYRIGGARKLPLAGHRLTGRKPPRAKVLGPTSAAGFYRRDAVEAAGDWEEGVGDIVADVDLACTLKHLGYRSIFEPASRIRWQAETSGVESLQAGRAHERLFWRQANAFGCTRAMLLHPFAVLGSLIGPASRRLGLPSVLGRILAACESAYYREYRDFLLGLREHPATLTMQRPSEAAAEARDRRMAA